MTYQDSPRQRFRAPAQPIVITSESVGADLVQEARRVARQALLIELRDQIERVRVAEYNDRSYSKEPRKAEDFKRDVLAILAAAKEDDR